MIPQNEIVMLMIGLAALAGTIAVRAQLQRISHWRLLVGSFVLILLGWTATVLEHVILGAVGNYIEHGCYALGAVGMAVWCWRCDGAGWEEK